MIFDGQKVESTMAAGRTGRAWAWLAAGFVGMLLFSPGVAVFTLVVLAGWLWLRSERRRIPWRAATWRAGRCSKYWATG
jgi:hypothetical protein